MDLSQMNYEKEKARQQTIDYEARSFRAAIVLVFATALAITGAVIWVQLDDNGTEIQIETDRIAACAASDDVVGCLEAVSD